MDHALNDPLYRYVPSREDAARLCRAFGAGDLSAVERDLGGAFNVNLLVRTSAERFVIRVASALTTEPRLRYIRQLQERLAGAGLPVVMPLRVRDGEERWLPWHGRLVQVLPFVPSAPLDFTWDQMAASGSMLKQLHEALAGAPSGPQPQWSSYPTPRRLAARMDRLRATAGVEPDLVRQVETLEQEVRARWAEVEHGVRSGMMHGDWHMWNQLFDRDGSVVALLDFDFVEDGAPLHDVAYGLWSILTVPRGMREAAWFLEGYGALTPGERQALPAAAAHASLFFLCAACFNTVAPLAILQRRLSSEVSFIRRALSEEGEAWARMVPGH